MHYMTHVVLFCLSAKTHFVCGNSLFASFLTLTNNSSLLMSYECDSGLWKQWLTCYTTLKYSIVKLIIDLFDS